MGLYDENMGVVEEMEKMEKEGVWRMVEKQVRAYKRDKDGWLHAYKKL